MLSNTQTLSHYKHTYKQDMLLLVLFVFHAEFYPSTYSLPVCRNSCGASIQIDYPFGIDDGCGAPTYRNMLNCSNTFGVASPSSTITTGGNMSSSTPFLTPTFATPSSPTPSSPSSTTTEEALFFQTPSGSYKVESIDYASKTLTIYDPSMSTCTILQPHHDFVMSDIQSALIPPSPDTVFALMNCSIDSPVLNHYKSLCFNLSSQHSCDDLYDSCTSFKIFQMVSNNTPPPPCCFTSYSTLKFMSMNILDCTHYTSFYDVNKIIKDDDKPLDWSYGIKLSYSLPDTGCDRCRRSGGTCGFDVETEGMVCICSPTLNSSRECVKQAGSISSTYGPGTTPGRGEGLMVVPFLQFSLTSILFVIVFGFRLL